MHRKIYPLLLTLCLFAACDEPTQIPAAAKTEQPASSPPAAWSEVPSEWLGIWTGPEGTDLELLEDGRTHKVSIRNLDGVRTFEAVGIRGGLTFDRDGTKETIKPGSGKDTGMKWLLDKENCLVVKLGEGYCRG
jgi:hypothetical protein